LLSEAATLFCLLLYLGGCAAAIKYRLPGAYVLTAIGGAFCMSAIAWSSWASLKATGICLIVLALFYLPAMWRKTSVRRTGSAPERQGSNPGAH
jgi:hypothetical protein